MSDRNVNKKYSIEFDRASIRSAYKLKFGRMLSNDECDAAFESLERMVFAKINRCEFGHR